MTLTLDVSPETVQRVERAKSQGANMDTLLCLALEQWFGATESVASSAPRSLASLAGKYQGEAWEELLAEIERNRQQEAQTKGEGK
jgi:hypothetical protein